jgi:hypothetical protein
VTLSRDEDFDSKSSLTRQQQLQQQQQVPATNEWMEDGHSSPNKHWEGGRSLSHLISMYMWMQLSVESVTSACVINGVWPFLLYIGPNSLWALTHCPYSLLFWLTHSPHNHDCPLTTPHVQVNVNYPVDDTQSYYQSVRHTVRECMRDLYVWK